MAIFNRGEPTPASRDTDPATTTDTATTGTRTVDREPLRDEPASRAERAAVARENAYERFGGINWGAAFFGWLVTIAVTVLLTSIIGAVVAAVSDSTNVTQTDAERQAGTIGMAAAI